MGPVEWPRIWTYWPGFPGSAIQTTGPIQRRGSAAYSPNHYQVGAGRHLSLWQFIFEFRVLIFAQVRLTSTLGRKMGEQRRSIPFRIGRGIILGFPLIIGAFCLDYSPRLWNKVTPPSDLKTIDEFRVWLDHEDLREGIYGNSGERYTVVIGESGAFLASGPSAYVFDSSGVFIDWTADMGDAYTRDRRFDLTSGQVKFSR